MLSQSTPNAFVVLQSQEGIASPDWQELAAGCHPTILGLARAGLSAVAAATQDGYVGSTPLLGESIDKAGLPSVVSQQFRSEFNRKGKVSRDDFELAVSGIRVIAAARAASALLASDQRINRHDWAKGASATLPIPYHIQGLVHAVFEDAIIDPPRNLQVFTQHKVDAACKLQFAASTGFDASIFTDVKALIQPGEVRVETGSGRRHGDRGSNEPSYSFRPLERFAQAIQTVLASY